MLKTEAVLENVCPEYKKQVFLENRCERNFQMEKLN